jgi:hypothetical protein
LRQPNNPRGKRKETQRLLAFFGFNQKMTLIKNKREEVYFIVGYPMIVSNIIRSKAYVCPCEIFLSNV